VEIFEPSSTRSNPSISTFFCINIQFVPHREQVTSQLQRQTS
jgi:hypothetical protein